MHPIRNPEVHEKIALTGKGCVCIFSNVKGTHDYLTHSAPIESFWDNGGVEIRFEKTGHAVIRATFDEPGAKIILFGTE